MRMLTEADILYENGDYWICTEEFGTGRRKPKSKAFCVYKNGLTHSTRVATIGNGPGPQLGLQRAIAEADKRAAADNKQPGKTAA